MGRCGVAGSAPRRRRRRRVRCWGQCRGQEVADVSADLRAVGFQREVAGVEQVELAVGKISPERLRAGGAEDLVVLAPGDEQGWLVGAEVLLERGVAVEVELVVPEQLQLDGVVVFSVKSDL